MKKIITLLMTLAMVMSLSVTAFASDLGESKDVTAKYEKNKSEQTIYNVDLNWGDLTFTYTETTTKVWNPETHTYTTNSSGVWDNTKADITVTNHSNAAVTVSVEYAPVAGTGVSGSITNGSKTLAAGVEGKPDEADSMTATLIISGKPTETVTADGVKIGTITVTIK